MLTSFARCKMPLLKLDPKMKLGLGLDHIAVLGSSILALNQFTVLFLELPGKGSFSIGSKERNIVEIIL